MRSAQLTGRLGRDPELLSPQNSAWSALKFSIANSDESKKNQAGEFENVTSWFDIIFWTKKPQYWLQKLYTGIPVFCDCEPKQEIWKTTEGQKRSKITFSIKRGSFPIVLSDSKQSNQALSPASDEEMDDDIPF